MSCDSCVVQQNCQNRDIRWECYDYNCYLPADKTIKSPKQIRRKAEQKGQKDEKKVRQGKRNKRAGKRVERELEKLLCSWGLNVRRVPLSGALKGTNLVGSLEDHLAGDLLMEFPWRTMRIESKKRENISRFYNLTKDKSAKIEDFCTLMGEEEFHTLLLGLSVDTEGVEDKNFKALHSFFEQDDSDIVAMKSNYRSWLFAIKEDKMEELKGVLNNACTETDSH